MVVAVVVAKAEHPAEAATSEDGAGELRISACQQPAQPGESSTAIFQLEVRRATGDARSA
jgi:hypothetical protein